MYCLTCTNAYHDAACNDEGVYELCEEDVSIYMPLERRMWRTKSGFV